MSYHLYIETDLPPQNEIRVELENGLSVGKTLSSFLSALFFSCEPQITQQPEVSNWFFTINNTIPDLCYLAEAWYVGDWDYNEDEYERFLVESPAMQLSRQEFMNTTNQIKQKWKDTKKVENLISELINLFESNYKNYPDTWFFHHYYTKKELIALKKALNQAIHLDAKKVRLKFY